MKFGLSNNKSLDYFWSFVYYHGMLNNHMDAIQDPWDVPGDLVNSDTNLDDVPNGIHQVEVEGKPATLYLVSHEAYGHKNGVSGNHVFKKGLIVWDHDDDKHHQHGRDIMNKSY